MPLTVNTTGRLYDDFIRLFCLHAHREASAPGFCGPSWFIIWVLWVRFWFKSRQGGSPFPSTSPLDFHSASSVHPFSSPHPSSRPFPRILLGAMIQDLSNHFLRVSQLNQYQGLELEKERYGGDIKMCTGLCLGRVPIWQSLQEHPFYK